MKLKLIFESILVKQYIKELEELQQFLTHNEDKLKNKIKSLSDEDDRKAREIWNILKNTKSSLENIL